MKKTYKMIASDMDGTLLKDHHDITPRTKKALLKAKENGAIIVIATGRPFQTVKKYVKEHPYIDYFIVNNGAAIYDTQKKGYIIEHPLDHVALIELIDVVKAYTPHYELHSEHAIYVHGDLRKRFFERMSSKLEGYEPHIVSFDHVKMIKDVSVTKLLMIEEDQEKYDILKAKMKSFQAYEVIQSQVAYIDVNGLGISKGQAIKELSAQLNIPLEDIIAFGDQENDLSMIQSVGFGVAMENAVQVVKEHASYITEHADEDGVAKAIETFML